MKVIFKFTRYAQRRLRLALAMGLALALHVGVLSFTPSNAASFSPKPRVVLTLSVPKKIEPPPAPMAAPVVQKKIAKHVDAPPPAAEAIAAPEVAQHVTEATTVVAAQSETAAVVAVAGGGNNTSTGASVGSQAPAAAPAEKPGPSAAEVSNMLGQYSGWLRARVDGLKHYPLQARRMNIEGVTQVAVRVGRDGRLLGEPRVVSSSHPILDQEALRMVSQAAPFPPLPRGSEDSVEFTIPINFAIAS